MLTFSQGLFITIVLKTRESVSNVGICESIISIIKVSDNSIITNMFKSMDSTMIKSIQRRQKLDLFNLNHLEKNLFLKIIKFYLVPGKNASFSLFPDKYDGKREQNISDEITEPCITTLVIHAQFFCNVKID